MASELINARTERGFSQAHLAEVSGVSRSAIKGYESGRNMPGARELRALCQALHVTPNRLLFGTEAPSFAGDDASRVEAMLRSDPEDKAVPRARLAAIGDLLTSEETSSLLLLAQAIATARHGAERVRQTLLGADFMAGIARTMMESTAEAARTGSKIDPEGSAQKLDAFLRRQGNKPTDEN